MPTPEQVERVKQLATAPEELGYFFDQLTSPDWLPLLRDAGLLGEPPEPIEQGDGVMFPFWPASRYMVRIAGAAPNSVAEVLWAARNARNPRVWWDTVDALVDMPVEHTIRFLPAITRWVHHPWRLGLETSAAKLVHHLIAGGARDGAIELGRSLARLLAPDGWPEGEPWIVLDDYDYGMEIPSIGRALAVFGPAGPTSLVEELVAFLTVERPHIEDGRRDDLSFIWRPAIEKHEQNWDFEREAKLVTAIRDGYEDLLERAPEELEPVVRTLIASEWPIVRRIGLHLLVGRGEQASALVAEVLTRRDILAEDHHRHELYRLLTGSFGALSPEAKTTFVTNVFSVADAAAVFVAEHRVEVDPTIIRNAVVRRWLSPISDYLDDPTRAELEAAQSEVGEDPHPDLPAFHSSWVGTSSPISSEDLGKRTPEEVVAYLAAWREPAGFGPQHPSSEGLAQQLAEVVAEEPDRFASIATSFVDLGPAYFAGLINGFQKALETDRTLDWVPVLSACEGALSRVDAGAAQTRDTTWREVRMAIARLLKRGMEDKTGEIPISARENLWVLIARLAEDPDPTPADEARYGPPNMDAETYSLNTIRGAAFHGVFLYLLWQHRHAGSPDHWSIVEHAPEASAVLDAHLDPERDPSVGVRAAYGWWLPYVIDRDADWVRDRVDRLVGTLSSDLELAAWTGFLFRGGPSRVALEIFGATYAAFAEQLAAVEAKPPMGARVGDPIQFFIDHLVKAWLWRPEMRTGLPLTVLVGSGRAWLVAEVVEEAGRLIGRTEAEDVTPELAASYRELWQFILDATANLEGEDLRNALSPFAWWFDSELSGDWTLPELLRLMDRGIMPEPDFAVFRRLPSFAASHSEQTLRVAEALADNGDERWTVRVHEAEIRKVLEASIQSDDGLVRERTVALIHRLGRLGLRGLAGLL